MHGFYFECSIAILLQRKRCLFHKKRHMQRDGAQVGDLPS